MSPHNENETEDPPSSFSGIWKKPAGYGVPNQNGQDWIEYKKIDDDVGNLWRVHDKLYDVSEFIKKHPGGSVWLELTQGTDITEAFESSHVANVNLVEKTLAKFYVRDATHPRMSPYTFEEDGFYKTLKRRVEPIFNKVGTSPTRTILLLQDGMVVSFLVTMALSAWLDNFWLKIFSGVILAWSSISAHNFFHLKDCWRKYYFDFGLLSSHEWRQSHSLSHHMFPNTIMDVELGLCPTYEFFPNRPRQWWQMYGPPIYSHFLYAIGFWMGLSARIQKIWSGKQKLRPENFIVLAELVICVFLAPNTQAGFLTWITIHTAMQYVFNTTGANAAHHHPDMFHDGDEARTKPDFGLCQLDATRDRAGDLHKNPWVIMVSFGEHCLHHLFPTVCHSKLHHIKPIFEQTLIEFNENFPKFTQWELYIGNFKQLARTTPTTVCERSRVKPAHD